MRHSIGQSKRTIAFGILLPAAVLFFFAFAVHAERLPVKIYTSADGLGSSASFNLVRDWRGFVWLCSRDGLVRFDGYRFITYRIGAGEADPAVFDLVPTRGGAYWINLNRGTDYRFVPPSEDAPLAPVGQEAAAKNDARIPLRRVEPLAADAQLPLFEDSLGNLWNAEGKGINLLRDVGDRLVPEFFELHLPGAADGKLNLVNFFRGQNDAFWVGTNLGVARRLPDGKMFYYQLDPQKDGGDSARYLAEDWQGRIWIARPDGLMVLKVETVSELSATENFAARRAVVKPGIFNREGQPQFPERAGEAALFSFADVFRRDRERAARADYLKPEFKDIVCGADGRIWLASNRGLVIFDGARFQHYTTEQGLATDDISSIAEDNEGHVWLASYGGLHRLNPKGLTTFDEADGLERARIHSIYEDHDGDLNVVSGNYNVSRLDVNGTFKMVRPQLPATSVWFWQSNAALLDSRGDWWVNTQENVYRYSNLDSLEDLNNKPPTTVYNETNGLLSGNNVRVFEDSGGNLWFGAWVTAKRLGLTRWERSTGQFRQFTAADGLPEGNTMLTAFAEDAAGNLWFGFTEGGIARFSPGDGRFTTLNETKMANVGIQHIYRDRAGRMWVATNSQGLLRSDAPVVEQPTFRRYGIGEGLTSDNVRCVVEDLSGNIYVGTVRGVNRLSPETGRVKYYGTSDGLASDFINTAFRDRRGAIWFGTFNGLSKLVPEPPDAPLAPPSILISGLRIAGEDYSVSPLGQRAVFVSEQSAERNNLQIDFLSVNTGGNAPARYQYKLEGADKNWSEPTAENSVTFANLSSGSYRFLVRAVNADDQASENPAIVSFTVLRPVWQRWWFVVLAALAASAAIYWLYRYRVNQIIKLERVRTRIATDLHDDIGSSLSKIAILSEVARQKNGGNGGADDKNEPLEIIANTSREMVDSMSDIVWAINPERDNLTDLIQRMRRFAEDILDAQDIGYQFIVPEHLRELSLGADVRRDVYLIFKECVNNLAKYADANEAIFNIKLENNHLFVEIADDGRGFDVGRKLNGGAANGFGGNGLKNMRRRAENFGGAVNIESEIGKGTRIVLRIPVERKLFTV